MTGDTKRKGHRSNYDKRTVTLRINQSELSLICDSKSLRKTLTQHSDERGMHTEKKIITKKTMGRIQHSIFFLPV